MKDKSLDERNCKIKFEPNTALGAINGYLYKDDGTHDPKYNNCIKAFVYDTKAEIIKAATKWANSNYRKLRNAKITKNMPTIKEIREWRKKLDSKPEPHISSMEFY